MANSITLHTAVNPRQGISLQQCSMLVCPSIYYIEVGSFAMMSTYIIYHHYPLSTILKQF